MKEKKIKNMIPTAEELLEKYQKEFNENGIVFDLKKPMIEFAKLHVEAALKTASLKAIIEIKLKDNLEELTMMDDWKVYIVSKDSITNSYPLTLIK